MGKMRLGNRCEDVSTSQIYDDSFLNFSADCLPYLTFITANRPTQDASLDTFRIDYLLPVIALLSLIINYSFTPFEILWSFSIWLESVAILPQLFMLQRTGEAEAITTHYLAALGLYRGMYIPNWIYR